jgi:hypothetical protein
VSYGPDDEGGMFAKTSGKKMAALFGLAFFGAFMVIQMVQGFPIVDLFVKETVTEEYEVTKDGNRCIVETPDHTRYIDNCPYDDGDIVEVTYTVERAGIESHRLAD